MDCLERLTFRPGTYAKCSVDATVVGAGISLKAAEPHSKTQSGDNGLGLSATWK